MTTPSYLLKITLTGTPNFIWRRFVVPSNLPLDRLHEILQTVMGWQEPKSHVFLLGKQRFLPIDAQWEDALPEKKYTLRDLLPRSRGKIKYIHDYEGGAWSHDIVAENIRYSDPQWPFPIFCLEGVRSCPPDDCTDFAALLDSRHPDHAALKNRFAPFDPDHFDRDEVNRVFGVDGPISLPPPPEYFSPKKSVSNRPDPLHRLGLLMKQAAAQG